MLALIPLIGPPAALLTAATGAVSGGLVTLALPHIFSTTPLSTTLLGAGMLMMLASVVAAF